MDENQMSEELFPSELDDQDSLTTTKSHGVANDDDETEFNEAGQEDRMDTESFSERNLDNSEEHSEVPNNNSESLLLDLEKESVTENTESSEVSLADPENNDDDESGLDGESELNENSEALITTGATDQNSENTESSEVQYTEEEYSENQESDVYIDREVTGLDDGESDAPAKLNQLPISKIKKIMKCCYTEDGPGMVSTDAAFLVSLATELFVAALAQEASKITQSNKKKTVTMQHLITTISDSEVFSFLEGTMVPDYNF